MTKPTRRRTRFLGDDWSAFDVPKAWEECTTSEKWRKLWIALHSDDTELTEVVELISALLREDPEPIPYEGKRLLAELLDRKNEFFDVRFELKNKRDVAYKRRRERDFGFGAEIQNEIAQHNLSWEEAIKKLYPNPTRARHVKDRYKRIYRPAVECLYAPWDEE